MRQFQHAAALCAILALSACGGGGGTTPVPPSPPPAPAVPAPVVSAVSPASAFIGKASTFSVTGKNLVSGMRFALPDCADITELSNGDGTQRQFSCTPSGKPGLRQGAVYAPAGSQSPLLSFPVDYQEAVVTFVANVSWRYVAIKSDGSLWTWNPQQPAPVKVGDDFMDVAVSTFATLAIKKDGTLWSWGVLNSEGILGSSNFVPNTEPKQIGTGFAKVVVKGEYTTGGESAEALKKDGSIWVWGARSQLQPNAYGPEATPHWISTGFSDIARGSGGSSFGLKSDGSLWTWNRNISDHPFEPVKIAEGYVAIATSYDAAYGLKSDGSLWNWGRNAPQWSGNVAPTASAPAKVGDGFVSISAGMYHAMALKSDGTLWAGGSNSQGQFGDGSSSGGSFRQVATGIAGAWAGSSCSFIKKLDGSLWAAGVCDLGDGKYTRYIYTPEQLKL
ncbi:RCC1 domain-containing protein [Pseudoduganella sp. HUAS MS19]